jgi:hypothetical protein
MRLLTHDGIRQIRASVTAAEEVLASPTTVATADRHPVRRQDPIEPFAPFTPNGTPD